MKITIEYPQRLAICLKEVLGYLEGEGFGQPSYGYFLGGDPRNFTPDHECCTEEEYARWKADCAAWERGEQVPTPGPHEINRELIAITDKDGNIKEITPGQAVLTRSFYGLGVTQDAEMANIIGDLRDLQYLCERAIKKESR